MAGSKKQIQKIKLNSLYFLHFRRTGTAGDI
jgi:hypothetical protein